MNLIEKIKEQVRNQKKIAKELNAEITEIVKNVDDLIATLQNGNLQSCLIYSSKMDKPGQLISLIFIDASGYTTFTWLKADDDNLKTNKPIRMENLFEFLETIGYHETKEILSILSDENSTFKLN